MPKHKLAIQKQAPDYPEITVEFEVRTKKEAIARSKDIIKNVAEQFSKGYYTAKLYRIYLLIGWCRVSTPEIAYSNNLK